MKTCTTVDPNDVSFKEAREHYRGLLLVLDDGQGKEVKGWIPEREGASCSALPAGAPLKATMSFACCDGDPNPPCYIGTANILTEVAGAKGAPQEAPSAPTVPPVPAPSASTEVTASPPAPAAVAPSEPAPGPRNCGCRVVGRAIETTPFAIASLVVALLAVLRRRERSR